MAKFVYCSECGTKLPRTRRALKQFSTIIDIVPPHTCPEEPVEIDLKPTEQVEYVEKGKFVDKLDSLKPRGLPGQVSTMDLRDRRNEPEVKTSAPVSVLDQIKNMSNSEPEGELED